MPLLTAGRGGRWGTLPVHRIYRGTVLLVPGLRNLVRNPAAQPAGGTWAVAGSGVGAFQSGVLGPVSTFYRMTKNAATTAAMQTRTAAYVPSSTYVLLLTLRASHACTVQLTINPDYTSTTSAVGISNVALAAGVPQTITRTFTAPAAAAGAQPGLRFRDTAPLPNLGTLDVTGLMLMAGSTPPATYRDGASPGWSPEGTLHDSASRGWS